MKVFDALNEKVTALLSSFPARSWDYNPTLAAPAGEQNQLILRRDMAYELGEGSYPSVCLTALSESQSLIPADRITLCGADLPQLRGDCAYARITLIRTEDADSTEQKLYNRIRDLELKKFTVSPAGFMTRASALSNREQVRVAKSAVKAGLRFENVGNLLIKAYRENPHVRAVWVIFITEPQFPYDRLDQLADQTTAITKALNHTLADLKMDCCACEWKPVCDTVDGLKALHREQIAQNKIEEEEP